MIAVAKSYIDVFKSESEAPVVAEEIVVEETVEYTKVAE